ncbi:transcription antitermination protein NusB [uncultured Gammaproteobacteria bacterium]
MTTRPPARPPASPPAPSPARGKKNAGSLKARRSAARLAAVQTLYQVEIGGMTAEGALNDFTRHRLADDDGIDYVTAEVDLLAAIVRGASVRLAEIDRIVAATLDARTNLERMETLLRAILRAGSWELLAQPETHSRIIINDYVNVTHAFFAGREPGMINGVLDHVARVLRPDEVARPDPDRIPPPVM